MKQQTETHNKDSFGLDLMSGDGALRLLLGGQITAAESVQHAIPEIKDGARALANSLKSGGRIIYAAAGSSALMALADGLELPGTFGISNEKIIILIAGGKDSLDNMRGGPEDDVEKGSLDIETLKLSKNDCLICVSASGATPYVIGAQNAAIAVDAKTIAIVNNTHSVLLENADISIYLATPSEIIAGSTRMGAATAQKIALNMMSTIMAIELGHIHDGHMVNVKADNKKLKERAENMVMEISNCEAAVASNALEQSGGAVKLAILLAAGVEDVSTASEILECNEGRIRASLSALKKDLGPLNSV